MINANGLHDIWIYDDMDESSVPKNVLGAIENLLLYSQFGFYFAYIKEIFLALLHSYS